MLKGLICREFGWTLNELKEQPLDEVMIVWQALHYYEARVQKMHQDRGQSVRLPRRARR